MPETIECPLPKKKIPSKERVLIVGAGNIGVAIANLLPQKNFEVLVVDTNPEALKNPKLSRVNVMRILNFRDPMPVRKEAYNLLEGILNRSDYVINAGPHFINRDIIGYARATETHYFDLSEDVESTQYARDCGNWQLRANVATAFVPSCGLAPGYVSILANDIAQRMDEVHDIFIRVGALPRYPNNRLRYNLSWSTDGLVNEYANRGLALENGEVVSTPPLGNYETLVIDGAPYEAFSTSGGIGTLHETWKRKAQNINYKTLRYPGHVDYMKFLMEDMNLKGDELVNLLEKNVAATTQDKVVIYVSVIGIKNGKKTQETVVQQITGGKRNNIFWTAIQLTTAAGVCGMIELHRVGKLADGGFIKQESAKLDDFLNTAAGQVYKLDILPIRRRN